MGYEVLNDKLIKELLDMPKFVTNPTARKKEKFKHIELNYTVKSDDGKYHFSLYWRQNKLIINDFSCGLAWNMPSGEIVTLIRYNGSSHSHRNSLENEEVGYNYHIHKVTERYVDAGRKPDGFAMNAKGLYNSLSGALYCLLTHCNIKRLSSQPDQPSLFI